MPTPAGRSWSRGSCAASFLGLLTLLILAASVFWSGILIARLAGAQVASDLSAVTSIFSAYFTANFGEIFVVIMAAGIILGAISSYLAVRRYLKV